MLRPLTRTKSSEGPVLYFEHRAGQPLDVVRPAMILARVAAIAYGIFRVWGFHPALLPDYRSWLELTPWSVRKPLPGGPIHLIWGDALVFGGLMAAAAGRGWPDALAVVSLGLIAHSILLGLTILMTGPEWAGLALLFAAGLAIRLWPDRVSCFSAACFAQAVGLVGLRLSLALFPWPSLPDLKKWATNDESTAKMIRGWPYDQLGPVKMNGRASRVRRVGLSLLAGWYFFAAEALTASLRNPLDLFRILFLQLLVVLIIVRTATYCQGHASPISLWARIRSFRWIVPGFDQIFVAPLAIALVAPLALDRYRPPFLSEEATLAIALAAAILIATTAGPDLTRWRLTGQHRIVASSVRKAGQELVKVG